MLVNMWISGGCADELPNQSWKGAVGTRVADVRTQEAGVAETFQIAIELFFGYIT